MSGFISLARLPPPPPVCILPPHQGQPTTTPCFGASPGLYPYLAMFPKPHPRLPATATAGRPAILPATACTSDCYCHCLLQAPALVTDLHGVPALCMRDTMSWQLSYSSSCHLVCLSHVTHVSLICISHVILMCLSHITSCVTLMPLTCHSCVTLMPLTCHSHVTHVPPTCHSCVTHMSLMCHSYVSHMSLMCHSYASHMSLTCPPGHFFLELTGLKPGTYYYKYIVDNTWAVNPTAPKVRHPCVCAARGAGPMCVCS